MSGPGNVAIAVELGRVWQDGLPATLTVVSGKPLPVVVMGVGPPIIEAGLTIYLAVEGFLVC